MSLISTTDGLGAEREGPCELVSDVAVLDKSRSESSESSNEADAVSPLDSGRNTPIKPRYLRQRNSGLNTSEQVNGIAEGQQFVPSLSYQMPSWKDSCNTGPTSVPSVATDFLPQFLLPQNINAPLPKGPVRKTSDFDVTYKGVETEYDITLKNDNPLGDGDVADLGIGRFRTREEVVLHFCIELQMLWRDSVVIFFGTVFQWFHSIMTNIAYYYHTQLTAAQRIPLKDVAYENLPVLNGAWWVLSEYLVFGMIFLVIWAIFSILFIRWNPPHRRPLYCVPIIRRILMSLTVCQVLRCTSFLVTTLPGASRQCLYHVPKGISIDALLRGPAPDRGNPEGWAPPITMNDILWRIDVTNGCGDLMFSSHTIFTMMFVCVVWTYFNWKILKWSMVVVQLMIVPFILAAHKHYSVDVFTALYVTPLVFEILRMKFRDQDLLSADMALHYGIRFHRSHVDEMQCGQNVIMSLRGGQFYVHPTDIPVDLQRTYASVPDDLYPYEEDCRCEFDSFHV